MTNISKENCEICGLPAISTCVNCGKALCRDHIVHGTALRHNDPVVSCSNCQQRYSRVLNKKTGIFTIGLIIIIIIVLVYFSIFFSGF